MTEPRDTSASVKIAAVLLVPAALAAGWFLFPGDAPPIAPAGDERRADVEDETNGDDPSRRPDRAAGEPRAIDPPRIARSVADAGNYTYVELFENEEQTFWIAAPRFEAQVGDRIVFVPAMEQKDFHSQSLGRTFDRLIFASAAQTVDAAGRPKQPAAGNLEPHIASRKEVPKLEPPLGGMTIATVYADRLQLKGQEIHVRGTITKVNLGILGANWYHLRDGSGNATSGDLTFTSQQELRLGQIVTLRGKLEVDHALGGDHKFAIFAADPEIVVESASEPEPPPAGTAEPLNAP